mgnify:FL=1
METSAFQPKAPLILWGRATSVNVQKVMWALAECSVSYDRREAGGRHGVVDSDAYASPNRRIPTLVHGDLVLWESAAIVRHLGRCFGEPLLVSGSAEQRLRAQAVADQWMDWASTTWMPAFSAVFWQKVRLPREQRDARVLATQSVALEAAAKLLNSHLSAQAWLGGDRFSMADIPVGATMYRYFSIDIERPALPAVQAWVERLQDRPGYREYVETSYDELRAPDR